MAQQTTRTANRKKQNKSHKSSRRTARIFWICLVLLLTPIVVLAWILISAALDTGSPILGNRYKGDLDPAITKSDLSSVKSATEGISGVEKVDVQLATATLRVYADVTDSATADDEKATATEIYNAVTGVLDANTYFTQSDGKKMYDLEIHVYNLDKNRDSDSFVYVVETKTSSMDAPIQQILSEPVDAELAAQLENAASGTDTTSTAAPDSSAGTTTLYGEEVEATPTPTPEG